MSFREKTIPNKLGKKRANNGEHVECEKERRADYGTEGDSRRSEPDNKEIKLDINADKRTSPRCHHLFNKYSAKLRQITSTRFAGSVYFGNYLLFHCVLQSSSNKLTDCEKRALVLKISKHWHPTLKFIHQKNIQKYADLYIYIYIHSWKKLAGRFFKLL